MLKFWVGVFIFVGALGFFHYRFLMMQEEIVTLKDQVAVLQGTVYPGMDIEKFDQLVKEKRLDKEDKNKVYTLIKKSLFKTKKYMKDTLGLADEDIEEIFNPKKPQAKATTKSSADK